ncbi:MAG TPA: hypothetical protein HPP94_06390 [Desulfuromonadales bacterium]|nr:hypothetical protein [Desulfuromonadales bacterium]
MPQIKPSLAVLALAASLALSGCGDTNPKAIGEHPSDWAATHKSSAKTNLEACIECHGEKLDDGIAKSSCFTCHAAGPTSKHPVSWNGYAYARHAATYKAEVAANPTKSTTCANAACHGTALEGAGTAPNCATTCHIGGAVNFHPTSWTNGQPHKAYLNALSNNKSSCRNAACHGDDLKGVFLSGPTCYRCHTAALLETAP